MKRSTLIFLIVLLGTVEINAQKLYICDSYTERGDPIGALYKTEFDSTEGLYAYALFTYNNYKLKSDMLYLLVDKFIGGKPMPFDSRALQTDPSRSWIVYDYKFRESGQYVFHIADAFGNKLASYKVTLTNSYKPEPTSSQDALYYSNCEIIFCARVLSGKPLRQFKALTMNNNDRTVAVMLNNKRPLKTGRILVVIWRRNDTSYEYDSFVSSKRFMIQPDWDDTFFNYKFDDPGEYKFSFYDENEKLIKSAFFTVYK
jgi:hypothetical protein